MPVLWRRSKNKNGKKKIMLVGLFGVNAKNVMQKQKDIVLVCKMQTTH